MAKSMLKTVAMATGVSTLLFVGFSSQTFAMSPFQASYQFNYNGKTWAQRRVRYRNRATTGTMSLQPKLVVSPLQPKVVALVLMVSKFSPAVLVVVVKFWCITTP